MSAKVDIGAGGTSRRMRWSSSRRIHPILSPNVGGGGGAIGAVRAHPTATTTTPRAALRRDDGTSVRNVRDKRVRDSGVVCIWPAHHNSTHLQAAILRTILDFRYIAIEGPIGVGKTVLAQHLGHRLDATLLLDQTDNPFVADHYNGRQGAAFQAQLFSLLARHRQQAALRQTDLFNTLTVSDYLFDKDKIYAYLNLDDNELFIYQRLYDLLVTDVIAPDLVVYLQTPSDLIRRRARARRQRDREQPLPDDEYLGELNEAYNHFFYHYTSTPLLVIETSQFDLEWGDAALDDLIRQLEDMGRGTRYYVPRTSPP